MTPTNGEVSIQLNGESAIVPDHLTVESLLAHLNLEPGMVVVERNGEILRRNQLAAAGVEPGDAFELVHFVGGG
jgi:thiamine biosynthesis protein ThiS